MHEFHAWIGLSPVPGEDYDAEAAFDNTLEDLRSLIAGLRWGDTHVDLFSVNGTSFLNVTVNPNRHRTEGESLDTVLAFVAQRMPGSWGLVYDRDDSMPQPYGPNSFRVRAIARGAIFERSDPFLSPCNPVIED